MAGPAVAAGQAPAAATAGTPATGGPTRDHAAAKPEQSGTAAKPNAAAAKPAGPKPHFDIDDFAVQGAVTLSQLELEQAIYPFLGPDKTDDDVEKARAALEKAYHDKGYQTVSVAVPPQNVANKVVVLKVTELKIGRLAVKNSRYFDINRVKQRVQSLEEGTVPNFNDVTKDVVSLNQGPDRKVTPSLRAGVTPGTVDVDLNVDDTFPFHGSVEVNDRQSPNTTPYRTTLTAHYDNLWQLGHSLSFSYQVAPERPADAIVYSASYLARLPNIDWLSFLLYGVDSKSNVAAVGGLDVIGPGQIIGGRAVITLPNAPNLFHTLSLGLDYKNFGETVSLTGAGTGSGAGGGSSAGNSFSTPVTYYPLVASYTAQYRLDKFNAQLTASLTNNLRPLSNSSTIFDNRRSDASPSFTHANIDLSLTQDMPAGFQLYGRLQGQAADGPLVSSEQFAVGGFDTVRGYLEAETLGDEGAAGTFEFRSPNLSDLLPKAFTASSGSSSATPAAGATSASASPPPPAQAGASAVPLLNEARLFGFIDAGIATVLQPASEEQAQFELWSYGVGTTFKMFDHVNGMVAVAVPMVTQAATQAHGTRVDFRIWGEF